MIACLFRFPFRNTMPKDHYVGMAIAPDMESLFWQIDTHGDPFDCEIAVLTESCRGASIFFRVEFSEDEGEDPKCSDIERHTYDNEEDRDWFTPSWKETEL